MGRAGLGLVHVYTGDGKGKTTAAFGLALRAQGRGLKVLCIQFLKSDGKPSGEVKSLKGLRGIKVIRYKQVHPMFWKKEVRRDKKRYTDERKKLRASIVRSIEDARSRINSRRYDLVILDEIINVISGKLADEKIIADLVRSKPETVELVLTGRGATKGLLRLADYVTVMECVKHPFRRGIPARSGIEE